MNKKMKMIAEAYERTRSSSASYLSAIDAEADLSALRPIPYLIRRVEEMEELLRDVQSAAHIADILALRPIIAEYLERE